MAKRSRANRTEKATYQNIRNEHKYIDVVHHGDGQLLHNPVHKA